MRQNHRNLLRQRQRPRQRQRRRRGHIEHTGHIREQGVRQRLHHIILVNKLHHGIKPQQHGCARLAQEVRHARVRRGTDDVGEAQHRQPRFRVSVREFAAKMLDFHLVAHRARVPTTAQRVCFAQKGGVIVARAIDGGAAFDHDLAHAGLRAGAKQVDRAHDVALKGGFAVDGRGLETEMANGVYVGLSQQVGEVAVAQVALEVGNAGIRLRHHLLIQPHHAQARLQQQPPRQATTPVTRRARDQNSTGVIHRSFPG